MLTATDLSKFAHLTPQPPPRPPPQKKGLKDSMNNKVSDNKLTYPLFAFAFFAWIQATWKLSLLVGYNIVYNIMLGLKDRVGLFESRLTLTQD